MKYASRRHWQIPGLGFCAVAFLLLGLSMQLVGQSSDADPRVQELYAAAKAAQARGDLARAVEQYESILKVAPTLGPAYNNLGLLYFQQGNFRRAAAVLEKGLRIDPAMTSALALLGISYFQIGEFAKARSSLESALHRNPADTNAELFLAKDLIKLEDFEGAASRLRKLTALEPKNQEVWYLLGKVYMKLSEESLAKMNAIDANSVWAHQLSGEVMESMKNYDGALIEYRKVVELAPRQTGTHYMLGNIYRALGQWDSALKEYRAETGIDPDNCMAHWRIGNILLQQNQDPKDVLTEVDEALTLCPNLAQARSDRGTALLKLNRPQEALPELATAAKAEPDDPTVHFHLAQAYRALGRTDDAKSEMQIFSKLQESARAAEAQRAQEATQSH